MSISHDVSGYPALGFAATTSPAPELRVLLIGPYGPGGGGMGRMMDYFVEAHPRGLALERVESRGRGGLAGSVWCMLKASWRIVAASLGPAPTIIHLNVAERGSILRKGLLLLLARGLGLPTVLHLHAAELTGFYAALPRPLRLLMGVPFRAADACVVLGTFWADYLHRTLGVDPARIEVLRNGVPRPVLRRFPPPPSTATTLLFLGNLQARKGLTDLLHALANPRIGSFDWRLVVAGAGDTAPARRLATALGIDARVRFTGWLDREATTYLLTQASALVLPSYAEGLPLVLLEAASLGVPIVATRVGAIPESFIDSETALLVNPGDRKGLAAALHLLLAEPSCGPQLARHARTLYQSSFTLDQFIAGLRRIYERHCVRPVGALVRPAGQT
jgi:glycosyltransferase involved in cell wall biosynthesis